MNYLTIENKSGKVKLNETVTKQSITRMIEEIGKLFGASAAASGADFGEIMNAAENAVDTLEIEINSPGGSVFDGYTIYQEIKSLRDRGVEVNATITGMAASMASVICMACNKVKIVPHGRMMIHDASNTVSGNAATLRLTADLLDGISDDIAEIYSEKTGKSKDEMRELMKKETWMSAKEAVALGFADSIFDTKSNVMSILDKFKPDAALVEKVQGLEASLQESETQISEVTAALTERTADLENAINELSQVKAQVVEFENKVNEITAERDTANASLTEAQAKVAELEAAVTKAEESANARAIEIAAQAGLAPLDVSVDEDDKSKQMSRADFNKLNAKAKSDFCIKGGKII